MMNLLHTIGLMTRAEHEAWVDTAGKSLFNSERDLRDMTAKFKRAATDLAAQAEEIAQMKVDMSRAAEAADNYLNWIAGLEAEVQALRPDAEAMRKKRAADRKRMAGKRNG